MKTASYLFTSYVNHPAENAQFFNNNGDIQMKAFGQTKTLDLEAARNIAWNHLNRGVSFEADFFRASPKKAQAFMVDSLLGIAQPLPYQKEFSN